MKEMVGGCCVCSDERGWAENPLVYCDGNGCNVAVHQGGTCWLWTIIHCKLSHACSELYFSYVLSGLVPSLSIRNFQQTTVLELNTDQCLGFRLLQVLLCRDNFYLMIKKKKKLLLYPWCTLICNAKVLNKFLISKLIRKLLNFPMPKRISILWY